MNVDKAQKKKFAEQSVLTNRPSLITLIKPLYFQLEI